MSFRCRQKFVPSFGSAVFEPEEKELPSGVLQVSMVDSCQKTMPKPELFDLKNQLESGLNLEEVNSKVMTVKSVNADSVVRKYTKQNSTEE